MDDRSDELLKTVKNLYKEIENKREIISFAKLTGKSDLIRQCKMLFPLQVIVNQSIQTGNYRKAVRYVAALKLILRNLEASENEIQNILTSRILE